jgi:hypothetical protein
MVKRNESLTLSALATRNADGTLRYRDLAAA